MSSSLPNITDVKPQEIHVQNHQFPLANRQQMTPYLPDIYSHGSSTPRPFVTLTYASSLDSRIASTPGKPTPISTWLSASMTHWLRTLHDAILVGSGTAISDNPTLNSRLLGSALDDMPQPVILDRNLSWNLGPSSKVVRAAHDGRGKAPWVLYDRASEHRIQDACEDALENCGGEYIACAGGTIRDALMVLYERGVQNVMIEGGATIINQMLSEYVDCVDQIIVTIAPIYLGQDGVQVAPPLAQSIEPVPEGGQRLQEVSWFPLSQDVIMCGKVHHRGP